MTMERALMMARSMLMALPNNEVPPVGVQVAFGLIITAFPVVVIGWRGERRTNRWLVERLSRPSSASLS